MGLWKFFTGQAASMVCPKCGTNNLLPACDNCEHTAFTRSALSDGTMGFYCNNCSQGVTWIPCRNGCGANLPAYKFD